MRLWTIALTAALLSALTAVDVYAQTLWYDDFNTDTSGAYEVLIFTEGRDGAIFDFDYSSVGIPEAPNSPDGGTTGVKFFVNDPFEDTAGVTSGVQIAPDLFDVLLDEDYRVTFDVWMNVNGPLPGGGGGSTEAMMVGVGFTASRPIEAGLIDGTYFTVTGEGGACTDVRSFTNDGFNGSNDDGSFVSVTQTSTDAGCTDPQLGVDENEYYHSIFPGGIDVGALPVQGGVDNQTGVTIPGQMAFEWHAVRVDVIGNEVSFYIDDLLIARDLDATIDGTIFVGMADYFPSVTDVPEWNFSVVDNLRVSVLGGILGDFDGDGLLTAEDIDLLSAEVQQGGEDLAFDVNGDGQVLSDDRDYWVEELKRTYFGDSNLDGEFNSSDFVAVFTAGEYEDTIDNNSTWETGDWNGDFDFDSSDFVKAFQGGGFEIGPRPAIAAVPEPSTGAVAWLALAVTSSCFRRRQRSK